MEEEKEARGLIYDMLELATDSATTPIGKIGVITFKFSSSAKDVPACPPIMFLGDKAVLHGLNKMIREATQRLINLPEMA